MKTKIIKHEEDTETAHQKLRLNNKIKKKFNKYLTISLKKT